MRFFILLATHVAAAFIGFAAGIFLLPIIAAPPPPTHAEMQAAESLSDFQGTFRRDLRDSDALHWGEGTVFVGDRAISLRGKIAPGPAYRLYLSPEFVETEAAFKKLRPKMTPVGDLRTFDNFVVSVPATVRPADYTTVVIWCEAFDQFITAAKYR